eukprot:scaffold1071_cov328-Pavlova_lutheri.AAC.5
MTVVQHSFSKSNNYSKEPTVGKGSMMYWLIVALLWLAVAYGRGIAGEHDTASDPTAMLHVVLAPEGTRCTQIAVLIYSILRKLAVGCQLHVYLFFGEMDPSYPSWLENHLCKHSSAVSIHEQQVLPVERFVYVDADIIFQHNIRELFDLNMGNLPVGAVEDCSQRNNVYFHNKRLYSKHFRSRCVAKRGLVVIDTRVWQALNMTDRIFLHMRKSIRRPLWKYGVSQPPFLLVIYQTEYFRISPLWSVRGLGRDEFIGQGEFESMVKSSENTCSLDYQFNKQHAEIHPMQFLQPLAYCAFALHYNGR